VFFLQVEGWAHDAHRDEVTTLLRLALQVLLVLGMQAPTYTLLSLVTKQAKRATGPLQQVRGAPPCPRCMQSEEEGIKADECASSSQPRTPGTHMNAHL
jgi:hypothetical protein